MDDLRKILIIFLVIAGLILLFFAVKAFSKPDYSFQKFLDVYRSKGKETHFTVDDIRKGLGK